MLGLKYFPAFAGFSPQTVVGLINTALIGVWSVCLMAGALIDHII
jgi:hypothetical protein